MESWFDDFPVSFNGNGNFNPEPFLWHLNVNRLQRANVHSDFPRCSHIYVNSSVSGASVHRSGRKCNERFSAGSNIRSVLPCLHNWTSVSCFSSRCERSVPFHSVLEAMANLNTESDFFPYPTTQDRNTIITFLTAQICLQNKKAFVEVTHTQWFWYCTEHFS